jgi:hypothetical protein
VPSSYTFWDLHVAIQDAMGWLDCHLHEFRMRSPTGGPLVEIGIPSDEDFWDRPEPLCGWEELIASYFTLSNRTATYVYDFGDGWEHSVVLEEIAPLEGSMVLPVCVAGRRRCPPEDCGGTGGFERFLEIMGDASHPEYEEMLAWVGGAFDPSEFDRAAVRFDDPYERWQFAFESDPEWIEAAPIMEPTLVVAEAGSSKMTPQARLVWDSIPDRVKMLLLNSVWCSACGKARTIVRYEGRIEVGDLILEGVCGTCGGAVARLVEGD